MQATTHRLVHTNVINDKMSHHSDGGNRQIVVTLGEVFPGYLCKLECANLRRGKRSGWSYDITFTVTHYFYYTPSPNDYTPSS